MQSLSFPGCSWVVFLAFALHLLSLKRGCSFQPSIPSLPLPHHSDCPQVQAIYDYKAAQPDELSLERGDVVKVYRKMADGESSNTVFQTDLSFILMQRLCLWTFVDQYSCCQRLSPKVFAKKWRRVSEKPCYSILYFLRINHCKWFEDYSGKFRFVLHINRRQWNTRRGQG